MTDDEFTAMFDSEDPRPRSNVRVYATIIGLLLLFWGGVVLLAVAAIA